jgi:hypothetical protein
VKRRWALLLAVLWGWALLVADAWVLVEFRIVDTHMKRMLEELFSAPVSFGELSISPTFDLVATDIRMMRPDNPEKLYGTVDEIRVAPSWIDLITRFRLQVKDIAIRHPTLVVKWHDAERTFDMPSPLKGDLESQTKEMELPAIRMQGLTLALENPPDIVKQKQNFTFNELSLVLAPEGSERWLYKFEVDLNHPILGRMRGWGRFSQDEVNVELERHGLMVTPELLAVLIPEVRSVLENVSIGGDLRLTARVGRVAGAGSAEAFSASIDCLGLALHFENWPQAVSKIQGRLEYFQGRLFTEVLTAEFEKAPLTLRGFVDLSGAAKVVEASGDVVGLGITNQLAERIAKLPDPCPTVADQITAWEPDGFANVKFRLSQERNERQEIGPIRPAFEVEFKGSTTLKYAGHIGKDGKRHGFRYPLEDLRGIIKFTDEVASFDRLVAMNGSLAVEARGRINYEKSGDETYDVDVTARGLRLDERVGAALQGSSRDLFNSLDAEGSADLAVAVKRQKGEPPGPRVDITVDLQGVGFRSRSFPIDLADTRGRLVITDAGPIVIEKVNAKRRGGSLSLRGSIPVDRRVGAFEMDFEFDKFPIDHDLTSALKEVAPDAASGLAKLNPTGRVDGTVRLALDQDGAQKDLRGAIRFDDMTLAPEDPSIRIDELSGSLELTPSHVSINQGTTASIAGERFAVRGLVKSDGGLDLTIEAANFQIDRELLADIEPLAPSLSRFPTRPELTGRMSMNLHVVGTAAAPQFSLEADFHGVDAIVGAVAGLELDGVRGHLSVSLPGEVKVTGLTMAIPVPEAPGGSGGGPAAARPRQVIAFELLEGLWEPAAARNLPRGRLSLKGCTARGVEITSQTIALLPLEPEVKAKIENLGLTGSLDLMVGTLSWDGSALEVRKSRLNGARVAIGAERPVRADALRVANLSVDSGGDLIDLRGEFVLENARIFDIPMPRCSGRLRADVAGIRLESIDGDILGYDPRQKTTRVPLGKINPETSRFEAFFAEGGFDTHLALQEVNVPAALRALGGTPGQISGTMRSNVDMRGAFGDAGSLKGSGDMSFRVWNVVSLPVFYKMFNSLDVLSFFDQRKDPWTKVDAEFTVADRVMRLPKVRIDSPDLVLQGAGSLTFAGHVKADLKTNQGLGISPIGWVTRIISQAVFAGVRIEGPISDPRVDAYGMTGN